MKANERDLILLEFPEYFESERLAIRAPLWGDGAMVNASITESIKQLQPWMPWAQSLPSIEQTESNIRYARLKFQERKDLRLHLIDKTNNEFVGGSGLHRIDWQARKFEIGYWVRTSYAGQGYITEAVQAITAFAIEKLNANRIEIRCDERNIQSANVAKRSGFTLEGILRNDACATDGSLRNTMVFAQVRGVEYN